MQIEIIKETRLMGSYYRGKDVCWWTVWFNALMHRYEAYTEGDMHSECDCNRMEYGVGNRRFFQSQNAALAYLAKVVDS